MDPETVPVAPAVAPSAERATATSALEDLIASLPTPESSPGMEVHSTPAETAPPAAPAPPAETVVEKPRVAGEQEALAKFVEREVALSRERDALDRLRAEVDARMTALEAAQAKFKDMEGLDPDAIRNKPWDVLARAGVDPDLAVQMRLAEKLGSKAPKELLDAIANAKRDAEIRELRQEMQRRDIEAANRTFFQQVHDGAAAYVRGEIKNAPSLAAMAKEDAGAAHQEIMDEIIRDANARKDKDPNGNVISYEEATRRAEARLARYAKVFSPKPPVTTPTQEVKTGASTAVKPPAPTITRPLGYWQNPDREALREAAIREALAEATRTPTR